MINPSKIHSVQELQEIENCNLNQHRYQKIIKEAGCLKTTSIFLCPGYSLANCQVEGHPFKFLSKLQPTRLQGSRAKKNHGCKEN
jgi:hypothetical protein